MVRLVPALCRTRPTSRSTRGSPAGLPDGAPWHHRTPLRQIWDTAEFNEVFFDDLEVPVNQRIGDDGDGWRLATTVLAHERGPADIGLISKLERIFGRPRRMLAPRRGPARPLAPRVAEAYTAVAACRLHVLKSLSLRESGRRPGLRRRSTSC